MKIMKLLIILSIAMSFVACSNDNDNGGDGENKEEDKVVVTPVEIATVTQGDIEAFYTATATVETLSDAEVVAKHTDYVTKVYVEEGDIVKKGAVLAELESDELKLEYQNAEINLKKAETDLKRVEKLYRNDMSNEAALEDVKLAYEQKKYVLEKAKLNLENTKIKASISGMVTQKYIKEGNLVSSGEKCFQIIDFSTMVSKIYVPETELKKMQKGLLVNVEADAVENKVFTGKISKISPTIDTKTGTAEVEIAYDDGRSLLKPGMFVRIEISYDKHENTFLMPKAALVTEDENHLVYLLRDSIVLKKNITKGYENGKFVEINGLSLGDSIVTVGMGGLKDSSKVSVIKL